MELVVGTYREGSNVTERRPAQSNYFKTMLGAFQLIQGFAGYKWFIEVIQHPEKRIYTRSFIENPQDPKKPFVYDGFIDPTTPKRARAQPTTVLYVPGEADGGDWRGMGAILSAGGNRELSIS